MHLVSCVETDVCLLGGTYVQPSHSMLRFTDEERQVWGIHFQRHMPRRGEEVEWPLVSLTQQSNLVAHFAQVTDITGIAPKRNLRVRPYTVSRLGTRESTDDPGTLATSCSFKRR